MKFVGLRKFSGNTLEQVIKYVGVELGKALTDLYVGLRHLKFADNFDHFFQEVTFPVASNTSFPNLLKTAEIIWFPVRISYDGVDAATPTLRAIMETAAVPITKDTITLRNPSTTEIVTATILVMRK